MKNFILSCGQYHLGVIEIGWCVLNIARVKLDFDRPEFPPAIAKRVIIWPLQ